ncbi:MAG: LytTR family transcriptional regulator DNA-binding domain-containing protein [Bacteroidia bacterium]|jgi:two-component system LytT family response regulator|nr:LytTR family transcriptional regulator DNA-binding domain-containing protein [Bacteroidia bacterium]
MNTAVLINDKDNALLTLIGLLCNFNSLKLTICGTTNRLDEGVQLIKRTNPDLVFIDLDMLDEDGLSIYTHFSNPAFKIIFVSGDQPPILDISKSDTFAHLQKPLTISELQSKIQILLELYGDEQEFHAHAYPIQNAGRPTVEGTTIVLDVESGFMVENTNNIEFCKANQAYSIMKLHTGNEVLITKSLKYLERLLGNNQFYRIHKSYLVNILYICRYVKGKESFILLKSGIKIPVSVRVSYTINKDIKRLLEHRGTICPINPADCPLHH